ncbi:hypothetical protein [Pseudobacteroides cellulosolvens]|uniref:hypothetical protein n=1 Tax=Pseudobacteroides cellulosolvens TaxID=35825 RepID=UPI001A9A4F8B|nr:hypothetical protein [Pseudobacteroides cellulosolvens]
MNDKTKYIKYLIITLKEGKEKKLLSDRSLLSKLSNIEEIMRHISIKDIKKDKVVSNPPIDKSIPDFLSKMSSHDINAESIRKRISKIVKPTLIRRTLDLCFVIISLNDIPVALFSISWLLFDNTGYIKCLISKS